MTMPHVLFILDPLRIVTLQKLISDFKAAASVPVQDAVYNGSQDGQDNFNLAKKGQRSSSPLVAVNGIGELADDLRSGLFEMTHTPGTRPDPLQIGFGDKQPGLLPWRGVGESWICWNYPYPREVSVILISLPAELIHASELELLGYVEEGDSFLDVEIEIQRCKDLTLPAGQENFVLVIVKEDVAYQEWQLCWECPLQHPDFTASHMLHHLYINPDLGLDNVKFDLVPVPLTLGISVVHFELRLNTSSACIEGTIDAGRIRVDNLRVVWHSWKLAHSLRIAGDMSTSYVDVISRTEETLVPQSFLSLCYENKNLSLNSRTDTPQLVHDLDDIRQVKHISQEMENELCFPVLQPCTPGHSISLRGSENPLRLYASELAYHALGQNLRSLRKAMKSAQELVLGIGTSGNPVEPCISFENHSGASLQFFQLGTDTPFELNSGAVRSYIWRSIPNVKGGVRRLLYISGKNEAKCEEQDPSESFQSVRNSQKQSSTDLDAFMNSEKSSANSDAKKLCWNSVLDVMTQGHNLKIAHFWNSMKESLLVAVQVVKEDFGWRVKILPGCKISNKTGLPLTMSIATQNFSGNLSGERIFDTTDSPVLRVMPEENYEAGDQGEYVSVHLKKGKTGIETALSALRIWLGRGNGWSNAIKLYACEPQIQKLSPAGFEGMSPRTPVFKATNLNPGSLISVLTPSPSLLELTIWPAMVIKSDLPVPVFWKLTAPEFSAETFDQDGTKVIQTLANIGHPLQCLRGPQETLAISLSHQASGKPQYTDVWSAEIMTEAALSNSYRWGVLNSSRQSLPAPGQSIDVNVPNNGKFLQLKLAAEPSSQDLPVLHLRLLPFCNAQNCTDLTITISFSNDTTLKLDAMKRGIGDWDSQIQFPRQATLTASRENSNWISPVFDLKAGDLPLDLPEDLTGRSSNGTVKSISTLRLAVNISMQSCKQAGQSVIETLILNISHGVHATNLTNKTLRLVPGVANGRENSPLQVEMGQSATLPWVSIGSKHHRDRDSKESMDALDHRIDRRSTDGLDRRISMSVDIFDPGGSPSRGMTWEYVALHETSSRQRHLLGGNDNILLTCRVLQDKGRLHAVFFEEEQPPFVIQNNTRETIEVGYFLPEANKLGEIQHETPKVVVSVSAEAHCKICLQDHTELGWDGETEDEEAFLERITEQSRLPVPYLGKLRFRTSANDCWSELCPVQCGSYDIGRLKVILHSGGAALHCTLHSKDNHPECLQWNRRFTVEISQIQVSFLDDERLRLLGCAETLARPEKLSQLPQETLALQLNAFQANVNLSTRGEFKCCEVQVSAGSLEIATFLPHASQPYLCASVPLRTSKQKASHAPFQIDMEVFTDNGLRAPQMSFKSSWIQDMKIFLPTLAVTVDDSILAFLDTLSKLYANSRAIKDSGLSQGTLTGATPAQEKQIRQLPFSPAKKPAMLDLSALDNLDISARAITPHCAGSLSSRSQSFDPSFRDLTGQSFREDTQALMIPLDALQASELELYEEALKASANRLYVGRLTLGRISLLLDLHISEGSRFTPLALDTHATPISLPHIHGRSLFFRPSIMLQGLLAHYAAEALLNAPAVLGSLELLLNPTGLLHSMGQGFEDLVGLPMAALETGSPAQFIAGLGLGSASLVRHFSGWTLTSISGFSSAFSKVLRRALSAQGNQSDLSQVRQRAGLVSGIQGLAEGISSGVTGIYRAPVAGYGSGSGSGLAAGVGRGLLGVVGLPISGALELISSLSSGLASSTGIVYTPKPGRKGLLHGSREGELSSIPPVFHMDSRRTECHSLLFLKTLWTEIDCADSVLKGRHQDSRLMLTPHSLTMFDSQGRKLVSLRLEGQKLLSLDSTSDLSRLFLLVGLPEAQTFQLSFELDLSERQVLQESSFSPE